MLSFLQLLVFVSHFFLLRSCFEASVTETNHALFLYFFFFSFSSAKPHLHTTMPSRHQPVPTLKQKTCTWCWLFGGIVDALLTRLVWHVCLYVRVRVCVCVCVLAPLVGLDFIEMLEPKVMIMDDGLARYVCPQCGVKYKKMSALRGHMKECGKGAQCPVCPKIVTQKRNLAKHMERHRRDGLLEIFHFVDNSHNLMIWAVAAASAEAAAGAVAGAAARPG